MDSNEKQQEAYEVILPESTKPEDIKATLLYRPGHYDVLYKWLFILVHYEKISIYDLFQ